MPTISETELSNDSEYPLCSECNESEGAIWLCGEGHLCEGCFASLAGIEEASLFNPDEERAVLDFELPAEYKARAKAKLMHQRGEDVQD